MEDVVRDQKVIQMIACGSSQQKVAEVVGMDQPSVSRLTRTERIKQGIEAEKLRLLSVLPNATDNVMMLVKDLYKKLLSGEPVDLEELKFKYQVNRDMLKGVGVYCNNNGYMNINIDNRQQQLSINPEVLKILSVHSTGLEEKYASPVSGDI